VNGQVVSTNSINGLLVRIRTNAGQPLDKLTVSARFTARDIVYVIPENLVIMGNPGGPLVTATSTSHLLKAGPQQIQAVDGATIVDGEYFVLSNASSRSNSRWTACRWRSRTPASFTNGDLLTITGVGGASRVFEFNDGTSPMKDPVNHVRIAFKASDTVDVIEQDIATAINNVTALGVTATPLPYVPQTEGPQPPGRVALGGLTATPVYTPVTTAGLTVVGTVGVTAGRVAIPFTAADSAETVPRRLPRRSTVRACSRRHPRRPRQPSRATSS